MIVHNHHALSVSIIAVACLTVATHAQAPTTAPATAPALDPHVDQVLTALEQRDVQDLHARLTWRVEYRYADANEATIKRGEIWYRQRKPVAQFMIRFNDMLSNGRKDTVDERYSFDGQWYVELTGRTKTVQRREVRKADDPVNPYKLGEGPFPLPFGQSKADILREFEVTWVPPAEKDPPHTDHLRLVPRPNTSTADRYARLEFWVSQEGETSGLPVKVRVAKLEGTGQVDSYITMTFDDAELNRGLRDAIFEITVPPGYTVIEEKLEPAAPPPALPDARQD